MVTDITEKGLETFIVESLVNEAGYVQGENFHYDRDHAVDLIKCLSFLQTLGRGSLLPNILQAANPGSVSGFPNH